MAVDDILHQSNGPKGLRNGLQYYGHSRIARCISTKTPLQPCRRTDNLHVRNAQGLVHNRLDKPRMRRQPQHSQKDLTILHRFTAHTAGRNRLLYLEPEQGLQRHDRNLAHIWAMNSFTPVLSYGHHPSTFALDPYRSSSTIENSHLMFNKAYDQS